MKIEDYNKYYIQGSDHYLIPKDVFKELFNEMINWKEESQKQKIAINKIENIAKQIKHTELLLGGRSKTGSVRILDIIKEVSE